jgi:hypothetical protein
VVGEAEIDRVGPVGEVFEGLVDFKDLFIPEGEFSHEPAP